MEYKVPAVGADPQHCLHICCRPVSARQLLVALLLPVPDRHYRLFSFYPKGITTYEK